MDEEGTRVVLRYVEAHIRLDAATCEKKARQGLDTVRWHDQLGEPCGTVWIRKISVNQTFIGYSSTLSEASGICSGEVLLAMERAATNVLYSKPYFRCPLCDKRTGQIILAYEEWACRKCHGLGYRSQRLSPAQRDAERLQELTKLLRPFRGQLSRPRYMRDARFAELAAEYAQLRSALESRPALVPHAGLGLTVTPTWSTSSNAGRA